MRVECAILGCDRDEGATRTQPPDSELKRSKGAGQQVAGLLRRVCRSKSPCWAAALRREYCQEHGARARQRAGARGTRTQSSKPRNFSCALLRSKVLFPLRLTSRDCSLRRTLRSGLRMGDRIPAALRSFAHSMAHAGTINPLRW
jgi:hypothetical protein